jgi:hypothetical protein
MPETILDAFESYYVRLQYNSFVLKGVVVVWRGVSAAHAETSLVGLDSRCLRAIFRVMEQRGWKDYVHIRYSDSEA